MSERVKVLPTDLQQGIDRFVMHLCADYYLCSSEKDLRIIAEKALQRRVMFELEIKRNTAHLWQQSGQRRSVAWFVLADMAILREGYTRICTTPDAYFKRGDVLKSATWQAPAKNFDRGNVLTTKDWSATKWRWNGWVS